MIEQTFAELEIALAVAWGGCREVAAVAANRRPRDVRASITDCWHPRTG